MTVQITLAIEPRDPALESHWKSEKTAMAIPLSHRRIFAPILIIPLKAEFFYF